ncbi:hypothetical protein IV203_037170 [Nitzschia inconspicua]|uniref:Uncharacterized protein n=1 Tax=Nitzschia inconspicua TaxID=303405 RepID=A0A9K3LKN8_9STRA|nr:hypothetical protein IV203_037170 [Nitzschia inconspicua]
MKQQVDRRIWRHCLFYAGLVFLANFSFHRPFLGEAFHPLSTLRPIRTRPLQRASLPVLSPTTCKSRSDKNLPRAARNDHVDDEVLQRWRKDDTTGVYDALDELEREIRLENADLKLQFAEHQDSVEYMERGKHPLFPTIFKHVVVPMVYALVLYRFSATMPFKAFATLMDCHFWVFVVAAPMFLLQLYRFTKRNKPVPEEIKRLPPNFRMSMYKNFEGRGLMDPDYSCDDHVLFLLEYWVSAVKAVAFVPLLKIFLCNYCGKTFNLPASAATCWYTIVQLVTRVGAMVSLYQFPEMLYRLQRKSQPRPIGFFPTLLRSLVGCMLQLAPLGFISDFSKVVVALPKPFIYPLYASVSVLLYGLWVRCRDTEQQARVEEVGETVALQVSPHLRPTKNSKKLIYSICISVLWLKALWPFAPQIRESIRRFFVEMIIGTIPFFFLRYCGMLYLLTLPLFGPYVHIRAILRAINVRYCGNEPILTTFTDSFDKQVSPEEKEWKYSIKWREPERVWLMKEKLSVRLQMKLFPQSEFEEGLEALKVEEMKRDVAEGRLIWERVAKDLQADPHAYSGDPPHLWTEKAMKIMSKKHQADYTKYEAAKSAKNEEKMSLDDPLGVALHRGFGVGLGLKHVSKMKSMKSESGGNRRLQVLAIEKAIQRYNTLWDKAIELEKEGQHLSTESREELMKQREADDNKEIGYLAKRITELVPSTSDGTLDDGKPLSRYLGKAVSERPYRMVSSHEAVLVEDPISSLRSAIRQSVDDFLEDPFRDDRKKAGDEDDGRINAKIELSPSVDALLKSTDDNEIQSDRDATKPATVSDDETDDADDDWEPTVVHV